MGDYIEYVIYENDDVYLYEDHTPDESRDYVIWAIPEALVEHIRMVP